MDDIGVIARTPSHNCARKFADIMPRDERDERGRRRNVRKRHPPSMKRALDLGLCTQSAISPLPPYDEPRGSWLYKSESFACIIYCLVAQACARSGIEADLETSRLILLFIHPIRCYCQFIY